MKIVIDGNIGAGKTTQLGLLESKGWYVHREPIDQWPLKEFYEDRTRWAFLLHMRILQTLRPVMTHRHVVYERCLSSSHDVFWSLVQDQVHRTENEIYNYYFEKTVWYPDIYIYLAKDPEIAHDHVMKRHQTGDESISIEYLRTLDEKYNGLVQTIQSDRIYVVDANRTEDEIHKEICAILLKNELFVRDAFRKEV
jgi:thymidylate kinase